MNRTITRKSWSFALILMLLLLAPNAWSQLTFRGGINGVVSDSSGAVVPGASVEATEIATNATLKTVTSSAGVFAFPSVAIGKYNLVISAAGFKREKISGIQVSAGVIFSVPAKLFVDASTETVEVAADAYTLDTTTSTQTTILDSGTVDEAPLNGRDFTQLTALTPGFSNTGSGGGGSLNGTRTNQINWQIDGVDNNDIWHNIPAVNQGGVSGIAGVILPIDAIEQFSVQTNASAESGRNPGGTVTLGLKSGTNHLHGSAYYYNRNEALGAKNPFDDNKLKVRNYNAGVSVGGPVLRDHLFYFANYEHQRFLIGVPSRTTEPTAVWQQYASDVVTSNGGTVSPVSTKLLNLLWPSAALASSTTEKQSGPTVNNFVSPDPESGYSYNGVLKIDYTINDRNSISAHWFGGQGNQIAPEGSSLKPFYQVGPIHVHNFQATYNHTFSNSLTNQIVSGVNYFKQDYNDFYTNYEITTDTGLVIGNEIKHAPRLRITSFDQTGVTPPLGRQDISGQLSDNLSWVTGKHQFKFGGEFRRIQLDEHYHRNAQGIYKFNGNEGGWDLSKSDLAKGITSSSVIARLKSLADYLAGDVHEAQLTTGDPVRLVFLDTASGFAQDAYQVTTKLNLNFGLRWDYVQPFHDAKKDLSVFRPNLVTSTGLAFQGNQVSTLYDAFYGAFSPRIGASYQLNQHTVVRLGSGLYYDTPNLNPFLDNRPGNAAPNGVESNPGGSNPVTALDRKSFTWQSDVNTFATSTSSKGVFSIAQNFRPSYNINYNAQLEQSFTPKVIAQLGYVGSVARHLLSILDLNQLEVAELAKGNSVRPYSSQFPSYGNINEIRSIGNSSYNSLQATLRVSNWHRLSSQLAYTWSHAFDEVTAFRGALPQDSTNFGGDYGQSDFDTRHNLVGNFSYDLPNANKLKLISNGWQVNGSFAFHSGMPFTVLTDDQTDGTDEGNQRANQISNPYNGFKKQAINANWLNPDSFVDPANYTWGTSKRNQYVAPGYGDVDLSFFKNTKLHEGINAQLRVEFYNLFNRINFAPPLSDSGGYNPNQASMSSLQLYDTVGDFNGAPGIGAGEPFNTQIALKITF